MSHDHNHNDEGGVSRRKVLECMTWAGTGVLWTISGGVPRRSVSSMPPTPPSLRAFPSCRSATAMSASTSRPIPMRVGTLEEAINKINAMPMKPSLMIHTGDITHLSKAASSTMPTASSRRPSSTCITCRASATSSTREVKFYKERYGKGTKGAGYYSFDANGVHFVGLVNVVDLKAGGLGDLGAEQLDWLADDLKGKSKSTPVVVFAHIPLWTVYPEWGWGTEDGARALELLKRFGSVTVLNGHIHQVMQKVEGNVTFHTARSTAFPQPAPGTAPSPGPMKVEDAKLRSVLGIASVNFKLGDQRLAIIDTPLQG